MSRSLNYFRLVAEALLLFAGAQLCFLAAGLSRVVPGAGEWRFAIVGALALIAAPLVAWRAVVVLGQAPPMGAPGAADRQAGPRWIALVAGVMVLGLTLTILATVQRANQVRAEARMAFAGLSERIVAESQRRLLLPVYGMKGARGVYAASKSVERSEFAAYVASRNLPAEFPGVLGMGFVQRVARTDLDAFVASERADEAPEFAVHPAGDSQNLYVVKFIEPRGPNLAAWGYDLGSDPVCRAAAELAIVTGEPKVTPRLELVEGTGAPGFLQFVPVYRNGARHQTPAERREAVAGLVVARIDVRRMFAGIGDASADEVRLEIFDGEVARTENILLSSGETVSGTARAAGQAPDRGGMFVESRLIDVGGRTWTLMMSSTPAFEDRVDHGAVVVTALTGSALTVLMTFVAWSLGTGGARARKLASGMTAELAAAKRSAESALRETEALRRTLDEHAIFSVADASGKIVDINEAFCRISGYSRVELLGRDHRVLNSGVHPRAFWVEMWRTVASGRAWHGEVCNRAKDGSLYWVDSIIAPFRGASGKTEKYVSIRSDITARKRAEESVRMTSEMLRRTGAMAAVGGWELDVASGGMVWSPELYAIHGVAPSIEPTLDWMLSLYGPAELTIKARAIREAIEHGTPWDLELRRTAADGSTVWIRSRGEAVAEHGRTVKLCGAVQNVTAAHNSREQLTEKIERLQEAEELADLGHWSWDLQTGAILWSDQIFRIHRRDPSLGVPNYQQMLTLYGAPSAAELDTAAQRAAHTGEPYCLILRTSDEQERYLQGQGQARRGPDGAVTGLYGTVRDVTEQVMAERKLRAAILEAEAGTRAKSEFLANMSHEIRTPLTAILGFADLLREDGDVSAAPTRRLENIDTIRNASQHLLTVINDILDLSKIEADKMTVETVETPLARLMLEVRSLMLPRAVGKGVTLEVALIGTIPDRIVSDPTRLRQILMNLIGNAVKFTERGGVRLTARSESRDGKLKLVLRVEDTGSGMTPDQAERLFAPFSQADTTVTREHGGTGLGLTISRRLARLMEGDVSIAWTEPGKGSCFEFELPLTAAPGCKFVSDLDVVRVAAPAAAPEVGPVLAGRILLAEDGPDNQRLIGFHLRKAGAEVSIADNGRIALDMVEAAAAAGRPYDLLLSDMQMPEMDGYSLARTLRQHGHRIAIVALTAHAMAEDRVKCTAAGCDDYASKPIDKPMLLAVCARWMHKLSDAVVAEGGVAQG